MSGSTCWCSETPTGVRLSVQISANAKKTEATGCHGDALKIKLHAQPIDGKANDALVRFIAERLGLPQRTVNIVHGHLNKHKLLEISSAGLTAAAVVQALLPALE